VVVCFLDVDLSVSKLHQKLAKSLYFKSEWQFVEE